MVVAAPAVTARRDAYAWRLLATGASFLGFFLGALILRVAVLPALRLWPGDARARRYRARRAIGRGFWLLLQFMRRTGLLDVRFEGIERLGRPGQMVIANHPSLIDVVFLFAYMRDANCIVKQGFWRNPCTSGPVRAAGYLPSDGEAGLLETAAAALREGQTLIVFPEGTRTVPGQPPVFHRGAAAIALRGATTITPVFISVAPTTLTKAEPWYRIPPRRVQVRLRVGDDILPGRFNDAAPMPIASRRLNDDLHRLFLKELAPQ
jgi:1-acyl-sn-glycerol-3-phosphate acyltransferase